MYGNGAYTVIVYNGPCGSPVSDVFDVGTAGIGLDAFSKLFIHPNPSFGLFTLEGEQAQALPLRISVFNLLGQQIRPTEEISPATQWTHLIDLSDQPNGVYQLRLDNGQQLAHKQLLLQR